MFGEVVTVRLELDITLTHVRAAASQWSRRIDYR